MTTSSKLLAENIYNNEQGNRILEWGLKLFYFEGRKCIQAMNFASKYTLFLFDVKMADLPHIGDMIAHYILDMYANDLEMIKMLKRMFSEHPNIVYAKLIEKSIISSLNGNQIGFAADGERFYHYFKNNVLLTKEINNDVNFAYIVTQKIDGKLAYIYPGERFKTLVYERYQVR